MKRHAWDALTTSRYDAQRRRLDQRAKLIPRKDQSSGTTAAYRTCVIVGGRGSLRRLADMLAALIGDAVIEAGSPIETVDAIRAAAMGRFPRVVLVCPTKLSRPIYEEIRATTARYGLGWTEPVDLLGGLRSVDREAFLRHAIRMARGKS